MPWKSKAQAAWGHSEEGKRALGGEAAVHEWDEATRGKKLPNKVEKSSPMLTGSHVTSVKTPRQKRMPGLDAKPSVFFKGEEIRPKHPSVQKLYDFLAQCNLKKCGA